jgi:hypothetical protein
MVEYFQKNATAQNESQKIGTPIPTIIGDRPDEGESIQQRVRCDDGCDIKVKIRVLREKSSPQCSDEKYPFKKNPYPPD